ncbi:MAG: D-alanyl-D-alanine carboxypeptidase/D-alanyl-D-alanine-endopeptidase [Thermoanaerobaculia bacterium]
MSLAQRLLCTSLALLVSACASAPPAAPAGETLRAFIDDRISTPPFHRAVWGIYAEDEDGTVVYETNGDTLVIPASNRKLFTAAINQACFALDSQIPTELWIEGQIIGRALLGNVVIKGYGDPSFGGRYVFGRHDEMFAPFVDALRDLGIESVTGAVIGDGSEFDRETIHGSWQYEDFGTSYQAPIDALAFNENVVGLFFRFPNCDSAVLATDPGFVDSRHLVRCGPARSLIFSSSPDNTIELRGTVRGASSQQEVELVSIRDASLYAAQGLHDALVRSGIDVQQSPRPGMASPSARLTARLSSPFLLELLATMMKASQNLYADALFKRLGIDGDDEPASFREALEVERLFLTGEVGIHPDAFSFEDGSGLSVRNLVSSRAIVELLRWLDAPSRRAANELIFTIPGESGTLRRRLGSLEDVFHGKTGTLTGVNALSGIVRLPDGRRRYVSVIVNHHAAGSARATAVVDEIIERLASP